MVNELPLVQIAEIVVQIEDITPSLTEFKWLHTYPFVKLLQKWWNAFFPPLFFHLNPGNCQCLISDIDVRSGNYWQCWKIPFLDNYWLIFDFPFLEYLIELMVSDQPCSTLKEVDYWEPFQSQFRPGFGMKMILATVLNDPCKTCNALFWSYWTSLQFFIASTTVSYCTVCRNWGVGALFYNSFNQWCDSTGLTTGSHMYSGIKQS